MLSEAVGLIWHAVTTCCNVAWFSSISWSVASDYLRLPCLGMMLPHAVYVVLWATLIFGLTEQLSWSVLDVVVLLLGGVLLLHSVALLHGLHMSWCNLGGVDMHLVSWLATDSTASLSCLAIVLWLFYHVLSSCPTVVLLLPCMVLLLSYCWLQLSCCCDIFNLSLPFPCISCW